MDIHRPIPAGDKLAEQPFDLAGDSGNHRIVEDESQGRQKKSAQYHGDDDFYRITDVEIAALVGKGHVGTDGKAIGLAADGLSKLVHKIYLLLIVKWMDEAICQAR